MAAASTVSPAPNNSLPAPGVAAAVGGDDLFRILRHEQNQRQPPPSSLRQLLLVKSHDVRSPDHCIPAAGGEDPVAIAFLGQSDPVVEQENSAISEQSCFTRDLGNPARPAGGKNGGGGGKGSSTSSDGSEECSTSSGGSSGGSKPHQGNDGRWKAIQAVISRDGDLGLGHFILQKKLGCGDIGTVYLAELSGTSCNFAMKIMNKDALESRKKLPRAQTEREILERLDHPFLPTLYSYFQTEQHTCLVMEYCPGGDLHTLRQRRPGKCFSEQAARFYVAEVLLALEYLHMLGIVYRDLKPENVLVREDGHIMLSDFDLSLCCTFSPTLIKTSNLDADHLKSTAVYCAQTSCIKPSCMQPSCFAPRFFVTGRSKKDAKAGKLRRADISYRSIPELSAEPTSARSMSFVGTHEYLAPEIIKGEGHGSAVDWWTFGIFLYELLFGKTPFKGPENRATLFNVVGEPLRFPEVPPISFAAKDLIKGLLVKDPQQRLAYKRGATEIKQHPFFQSVNWALIRCASPPEMPKLYRSGSRQQTPAVSSSAVGTDVKSAVKCEDDIEFF